MHQYQYRYQNIVLELLTDEQKNWDNWIEKDGNC
jgi:hypothetical protein